MEYYVKLDTFEGPLDLLLYLIRQMEIDIYDIPMAEITEQYLMYIHAMNHLELNKASEYLVMSATLLTIKSKMLLPKQKEVAEHDHELEGEDPRTELVEQLIEYKKYKETAHLLKQKESQRSQIFTKPPIDLSIYIQKAAITYENHGVTVDDMLSAYQKVLKRKKLKQPLATTITRQTITVEERMAELLSKISRKKRSFFSVFHTPDPNEIVVTFLAVLELMKQDAIRVEQTGNFEELFLIAKEEDYSLGSK